MTRRARAVPAVGGGGGGGGGGGTLPAVPNAAGSYAMERETDGGTLAWVPLAGFTVALSGVTATIEVGTSLATVTGTITTNATPTALTVAWSGVATGSQSVTPTGTSTPFTITGPFTSSVNAAALTVTVTATFSDGSEKSTTGAKTWSGRVVFGSVAGTLTPGQTLWNTILADGSTLRTTRGGSYAYASAGGENQVFALLHSLGAPTMKDPNGFTIPVVLVGNSNVTENGTTQNYDFYTVGNPGSSTTYTMS